jgi:hypothetical protein
MRAVLATAVAALAVAAPAGAVTIGKSVSNALHTGPLAAQVKASEDAKRTCQAGARTGAKKTAVGDTRRPPVVACEQPPRSNLLTPDQVAKATAAALQVLG